MVYIQTIQTTNQSVSTANIFADSRADFYCIFFVGITELFFALQTFKTYPKPKTFLYYQIVLSFKRIKVYPIDILYLKLIIMVLIHGLHIPKYQRFCKNKNPHFITNFSVDFPPGPFASAKNVFYFLTSSRIFLVVQSFKISFLWLFL